MPTCSIDIKPQGLCRKTSFTNQPSKYKDFRMDQKLRLYQNQYLNSSKIRINLNFSGKLPCRYCTRKFSSTQLLSYHEKLHENPDCYKCSLCGKRFSSPYILKEHIRNHEASNFSCNNCGSVLSSERCLQVHLKTCLRNFVWCNGCNYSVKLVDFEQHMRVTHGKFSCKFCTKTFNNLTCLKHHEDWHRNPESFQCHLCWKVFSNPYNLKEHMVIHTDGGVEKLTCNICKKVSPTMRKLKMHKKSCLWRPFE